MIGTFHFTTFIGEDILLQGNTAIKQCTSFRQWFAQILKKYMTSLSLSLSLYVRLSLSLSVCPCVSLSVHKSWSTLCPKCLFHQVTSSAVVIMAHDRRPLFETVNSMGTIAPLTITALDAAEEEDVCTRRITANTNVSAQLSQTGVKDPKTTLK